jgi:hypothetical protein
VITSLTMDLIGNGPDINPIDLEFQLTTADFFRTLVLLNLRRLWFLLLSPIAGFADLLFKATDPRIGLHTGDLVAVVGLVLFYGFILVGGPYLSARSIMKNQNFMAPIKYRFAEGGIDVAASGSTAHHDWSMVDKVQESKKYVMLFAPKNCLHLIPKVVLADRTGVFKQRLRRSVAGKVKLWD